MASGVDPLFQTLALQVYAMLSLALAKEISLRCTDANRFAPLMLVVYYSVDMTQTFLFLQERAFSVAFFEMIAVQEAASIAKNSGLVSDLLHHLASPMLPTNRRYLRPVRAAALVPAIAQDQPLRRPRERQDAEGQVPR